MDIPYRQGMRSIAFDTEDLESRVVEQMSDDQLADHVIEIERAARRLEATRARAIAEVERRRSYAADGFLSATAWLVARTGTLASAASQDVRLARALPHMPTMRAALEEGSIAVVPRPCS